MKRIEKTFAELKKKGEKALVAYITAGYPDLETTRLLVPALERAGVDILEVGVPFSDPTADGPVIQAASQAALRNGTTLSRVLDLIGDLRGSVNLPLVLFSYYNPIFSMGTQTFARRAAAAGVDGVLVVDLPAEESAELRSATDPAGIDFIPLVAPTTGADRVRKVDDVGRVHRLPERQRRPSHHHDRRSDRVLPLPQEVDGQPAGDRRRRAELRRGNPPRVAAGP